MIVQFEVLGRCQPKQRPRKGKGGHFYTPQATKDYEREVGWAAKLAMKGKKIFTGSVSCKIVIYHKIPASWSAHEKRMAIDGLRTPKGSDIDNCCKGIFDGLNGVLWKDDRLVTHFNARKAYAIDPKVTITVQDAGKDTKPEQTEKKPEKS